MSKVTAPLFSLTASGTIGQALTYSRWKGIKYVRTRVIPANPNSALQQAVRGPFETLVNIYNRAVALFLEPWDLYAAGKALTPRNAFIQHNLALLIGDAVLTDIEFSRAMGGAIPPASAVSADGGLQILNITLTQPALPTGWTQQSSTGIAVLQGDPSPPIIRTPIAGEDTVAPFTLIPVDVDVAGTYVWSAFNVYTAPDGSTRVSGVLRGTQVIA